MSHGGDGMKDPLLYLIATALPQSPMKQVEAIEAAIAGGVGMVQMREKGGSPAERLALGRALRSVTRRAEIPLIVNDDPTLAASIDADGVHIGQNDLSIAEVRSVFAGSVGLSTHSVQQVAVGIQVGVDLLGIGPLFETSTKEAGPPVGVGLLTAARSLNPTAMLIGIGGIDVRGAAEAIRAGADGVAVCSAIMSADDPEDAARRLVQAMMEID